MGWSNQTLGDYCEVIAGQSPEGKYYNTDGQGLPFYQGKKEFGDRFIGAPQKWTTNVTKEAIDGDILMSVRAPVGPINFSIQKICIGRGLAAIRPSPKLNKYFLFYYLLSKQDEIVGNEGAVFASINKAQIEALRFSYVDITEQKRIVALLDTVFSDLEQTRAKTEQNLKNARELFDSSLQQAFSPKGDEWVDKRLEDVLLDKPRNGWSPPAKNHSDIGIPVLTLSAVTGFRFNKHKIKFTSATTKVDAHYWVNNGDLLITRSNTPALVGHVAICSNIEIPTIYPDLIMKLKLDAEKVDVKFIYYQLRSKKLRKIITSSAQGANPTMKKINQGIVQSLPLRYPSIKRQVEIVLELDSIYAATNKLEQIYRNKLDSLNELKKSILQKAFSGELTRD